MCELFRIDSRDRYGHFNQVVNHAAALLPARGDRVALPAGVPARGHHLAAGPELAAHGASARVLAVPTWGDSGGGGAPAVAGELAEPELVAEHALVEARVEAARPRPRPPALIHRRGSCPGRGRRQHRRDHDDDDDAQGCGCGHASAADTHCLRGQPAGRVPLAPLVRDQSLRPSSSHLGRRGRTDGASGCPVYIAGDSGTDACSACTARGTPRGRLRRSKEAGAGNADVMRQLMVPA